VEGGHELVGGVEGEFRDPWVGLPGRGGVDAALGGQRNQRALGRVADQFPAVDHRVGGEDHRQQELVQRDLGLPGDPGDLPFGRIPTALDGIAAVDERHRDRGHLVQRQRPGLVGVDR
jgi:hypothetical protein